LLWNITKIVNERRWLKITKYKGVIRLKEKPFQTIKWFTKNFKHEIGAIGIGKVENGEIVVEKLVFPKQIVNGCHVHFKPEDWGPIAAELTKEELEKVIFYWHKHPDGVPGASQGDEDDTFDVFMGEESERKMFGFLQTANKSKYSQDSKSDDQGFMYEGRIELRKPIWASITDVEILTDKDDKVEKACEKIIKDKITEGTASAADQPTFSSTAITTKNVIIEHTLKSYESFKKGLFKVFCYGCGSPITELTIENGNVKLKHSEFFGEWIDEMMVNPDLGDLVTKTSIIPGEITIRNLQPKKKQMQSLYKRLKSVENELFALGETGKVQGWYDSEEEEEETKEFNKGFNKASGFYGVE